MNKMYPSQDCMQFYFEIFIKKISLKVKQLWVVPEIQKAARSFANDNCK